LPKWYKKWFYISEELNSATFYDVWYQPEKRVSWTDRPEYNGQMEELMNLIQWPRLDGPAVVRSFISRRIQPCQRRVHYGYKYQGNVDTSRMKKESLEVNELFNLSDAGYAPSSDLMHAYKLARPPSKVTVYNLSLLFDTNC